MSKRFNSASTARPSGEPLDYSANLNPLGTPVQIVRAVKVAAADFSNYPDPECSELVSALASREDVPADQIIVTAGATDAFIRVANALRPHKALLCTPSYDGYERGLRQIHAKIVHHSLVAREDFAVTERILDYIEPDIDMMILSSPNNPTGRVIPRELLCKVLRTAARWGTWVVVDESFIQFTHEHSAVSLLDRYPQLIVVKSFTAPYAMAGLRVGWCICGTRDVAGRIREAGMPWAVSAPAQAAALAALDVPGYLDLTRDYVDAERDKLQGALKKAGMLVIPCDANFILFQGPADLHEKLLEQGVRIHRCSDYRGLDASWFRIAVRTAEDNSRFAAALAKATR